MTNWISIDDKFPGHERLVLICYRKYNGKSAVTIGWYAPAKTIEAASFDGDVEQEYDEETDTYYLTEQWADQSQESEYHYEITGVTHWMPLPEPPFGVKT